MSRWNCCTKISLLAALFTALVSAGAPSNSEAMRYPVRRGGGRREPVVIRPDPGPSVSSGRVVVSQPHVRRVIPRGWGWGHSRPHPVVYRGSVGWGGVIVVAAIVGVVVAARLLAGI